jgi:hypothetical protein
MPYLLYLLILNAYGALNSPNASSEQYDLFGRLPTLGMAEEYGKKYPSIPP